MIPILLELMGRQIIKVISKEVKQFCVNQWLAKKIKPLQDFHMEGVLYRGLIQVLKEWGSQTGSNVPLGPEGQKEGAVLPEPRS